MNIFRISQITDEMMNLNQDRFYDFLEYALDKHASELFRIQAIRDMSSLSSITVRQLVQIFSHDVEELKPLKDRLGFLSNDGNYHLRLGYRNSIERLLLLVKSKGEIPEIKSNLSFENLTNDLVAQLARFWDDKPSVKNETFMPVLFPLIKNILSNSSKMKNKYSYDGLIRCFALSLFILGGRNCYEFLRLNLPGALPHLSNIESLIKEQGMRIIEGEFRFDLLGRYFSTNQCSYAFACEDCTSVIPRISYDVQSNSFLGFSSPLNNNGAPKLKYFQTDRFDELKSWFEIFDRSKSINVHIVQPFTEMIPSFTLAAYGTDNKVTAQDILKRWLYIYRESLIKGIRIIGFSTDGDPKYLRAMRLCTRFFAELPNLNLYKYDNHLTVSIPAHWTWFMMHTKQVVLFLQDPTHLATKIRNRLFSKVASMRFGDYSVDISDLIHLIETKSKLEHNLIKCDMTPKDRQNFPSCVRISSTMVLDQLSQYENATGTYLYLSLLRLLISGFIDKSCSTEERLCNIWTVVFTCRLWWGWLDCYESKNRRKDNNPKSIKKTKINNFISRTAFWSIELNAHTLLFLVLLVIQKKLPIDALNMHLFSSQPCENVFRIARSLSGPYSSITNFTVESFLRRCEKISIINSIQTGSNQNENYRLKFPQHHKTTTQTDCNSTKSIDELGLTESDIERIIKNAFQSAQANAALVHMTEVLVKSKLYSLPELSQFMKSNLNATSSRVIDYAKCDYSSDETDDEEFSDKESDPGLYEDEDQSSSNVDDEEDSAGGEFSEVQQEHFQGCRVYKKIHSDHSPKFFRVNVGNSIRYIHKQTACWLLTTGKDRLSTDRLIRVRGSSD